MRNKRVLIAGLGDTGLLTAIHLGRHVDVVGISAKPGLVSGQELGLRLTRPAEWARDYWISFDRYRRLDPVRTVHGTLTGADLDARTVQVRHPDGTETTEPYDVLVIATGVSNGFWRRPDLQTHDQVGAEVDGTHQRLAAAGSVNVIGGGAAAVSSALNIARAWPEKTVDLYFPGERALLGHHGKVWSRIEKDLREAGVGVHPGHRAEIPADGVPDGLTDQPVFFSTGQPEAKAELALWAIGQVRPNTDWLPSAVLDEDGFVQAGADLRVPGTDGVFAIGDVAATDPLRTSARSRADGLLAANVRAYLAGKPLKNFTPATRRWGSVIGTQDNTLEVFTASGQSFRLRPWAALQPWLVRRAIYKGIRDA